jgi:hypothetical protein
MLFCHGPNSNKDGVYLIQHYVIKFVGGISLGTPVSPTNKTDCQDITEILLKVALNTITLTLKLFWYLIHVERQKETVTE